MIIPAGPDGRGAQQFWGVWRGAAAPNNALTFSFPGSDGHDLEALVIQARERMGVVSTASDWELVGETVTEGNIGPDGEPFRERNQFWLLNRDVPELLYSPHAVMRFSGLIVAAWDELGIMKERGMVSPAIVGAVERFAPRFAPTPPDDLFPEP
jgi:hypothetical protein